MARANMHTSRVYVGKSSTGQPEARNVHGKFHGKVKSYNREKGFGFIDCREIFDRCGRDVYVHSSQMGPAQYSDEVSFELYMFNGKPQAKRVTVLECEVFYGKIMSFCRTKGYGYIFCDKTFAKFGSDVYLHSSKKGRAECLDEVSFEVNMVNGKPQAKCVKVMKLGLVSQKKEEEAIAKGTSADALSSTHNVPLPGMLGQTQMVTCAPNVPMVTLMPMVLVSFSISEMLKFGGDAGGGGGGGAVGGSDGGGGGGEAAAEKKAVVEEEEEEEGIDFMRPYCHAKNAEFCQ